MSDTAVAINMVVLVGLIIFSIQRLGEHGKNQNHSKTTKPSQPLTSKEDSNLRGLHYDKEAWRVLLPQSVVEQLEVCFDGNTIKSYAMKRAIELSLEHYTYEMEDDKECADIIAKRCPNGSQNKNTQENLQ